MARPLKYDEVKILDAALTEGRERGFGRVSASGVARRLGAPSGSIYHRFRSRDALMASLWLRTVEQFQSGYVAAVEGEGSALDRARAAARYVVTWTRENRGSAELLLGYRVDDLLSGEMPPAIAKRAKRLNEPAKRALVALGAELGIEDAERLRFACVSAPVAAVRDRLVGGEELPASLELLVDETVVALLGGGS